MANLEGKIALPTGGISGSGDTMEKNVTEPRGDASSPKTIAVFLEFGPAGEKRAAHAAALAQRFGARLIGVQVVFAGVKLPASMSNARGEDGIRHVIAYQRRLDAAAEAAAARVADHFRTLCAGSNVPGEFRAIRRGEALQEAFLNSLHSDLVVVGHPDPHGLPDYVSPERIMLASGVPMLIVPNIWERNTIGERILIGWNVTREARRAISDAMAFLVAAKSVTVLVDRRGQEPSPRRRTGRRHRLASRAAWRECRGAMHDIGGHSDRAGNTRLRDTGGFGPASHRRLQPCPSRRSCSSAA